jgi:hypothetical protein
MQAVLLPALVLVVVAVVSGQRFLARRRLARLNVSGGRMSLVLNLQQRR